MFSILLTLGAMAQKQTSKDEWMKEMQQYKNEFMARRLELTEEQKAKFIPLYTQMDKEVRSVVDQSMKMVSDVKKKGAAATELEKEKAAQAQFECKVREGQIEMKYYKKFKEILTPDQLLRVKDAERKFAKELWKKHRERNDKAKTTAKPKPKTDKPKTESKDKKPDKKDKK